MKIFDFNIHLPYLQDKDVNKVIAQDLTLDVEGICKGLEIHKTNIQKAEAANFLLFNTKLFDSNVAPFLKTSNQLFEKTTFTALIDFRRSDILSYVEKIKESGVGAIMFNSYLQQISEPDFVEIGKICQFAEKLGLIICIDGSYGTSKMYAYDNLKLACFVADMVSKVPIVIVHSGGYRIIEAFLLADAKPNIWLDTSFSLPYYIGSSIEQDFAFVYKKMNARRIVFGTDYPYANSEAAIEIHQNFFDKHQFSAQEQEQIFYQNALELFQI
ncbi:amidohydrolase family protein [Hugenholtzia roseola]|uniref:amidohydrolase family protein n=1 Tax=Hugenholtzia roseola TaxID=1002 RepID=UPI000424F608|nr:amidohydrolase family protein [Hugenholtzia roseola]